MTNEVTFLVAFFFDIVFLIIMATERIRYFRTQEDWNLLNFLLWSQKNDLHFGNKEEEHRKYKICLEMLLDGEYRTKAQQCLKEFEVCFFQYKRGTPRYLVYSKARLRPNISPVASGEIALSILRIC
jgi:hypothetical protein